MEVKMQTSFIPKKPIVQSVSKSSGVSLFLLLAIILFIVSVSMAGGVWLWRESLIKQIEKDKVDLLAAKDSYEEATITPLIRLDDRIKEANSLLSKHLAVTPVFALIQKNVVTNVQLKSMKFSFGGADKIKLDLSGVARNYDALSRQSDIFGSEQLRSLISQPVISDFSLNPDATVSFNFSAFVASRLVSYESSLDLLSADESSAAIESSLNTIGTSTGNGTNSQ